jgi:hypothetical protein
MCKHWGSFLSHCMPGKGMNESHGWPRSRPGGQLSQREVAGAELSLVGGQSHRRELVAGSGPFHEQCVSTNVVSKSSTSGGQHALRIQTAPTLSKSPPVRSRWIIPGLPPEQAKSRRMISPVVCQKRKDSPVSGDCCTTVSYFPASRMLK